MVPYAIENRLEIAIFKLSFKKIAWMSCAIVCMEGRQEKLVYRKNSVGGRVQYTVGYLSTRTRPPTRRVEVICFTSVVSPSVVFFFPRGSRWRK